MKQSTITITNVDNIDYNNACVIDESKIEVKTFDSLIDIFTFHNIITCETRRANLMDISLYDDLIINEDGTRSKVLNMVTKINNN